MAVQIFKDGGSMLVEPVGLAGYLENGWSLDDPDAAPAGAVIVLNKKPPGIPAVTVPEPEPEKAEPKKRGRPRKSA